MVLERAVAFGNERCESDVDIPRSGITGPSCPEQPAATRLRSNLVRAARLAIVAAVVWAMGVSIDDELRNVAFLRSGSNVALWESDAAYFSCLTTEMQSVVPKGATVWVSNYTPGAVSWYKALVKVADAYRPVTDNSSNVINLSLVAAPQGRYCLGARVQAMFPSGTVEYGNESVSKADLARWRSIGSPAAP